MANFIKGKADLIRTNELKIESFESDGVAEIADTLTVKVDFYSDDDDVVMCLERRHRVVEKQDRSEVVLEAEIDISKEQAILLANYLIAALK